MNSPPEKASSILERPQDLHDASWVKSLEDLEKWRYGPVDDWRELVAPCALSDLDKSSICTRCEALDIASITNRADGAQWNFTVDLSQPESDCAFCALLVALRSGARSQYEWVDPSIERSRLLDFGIRPSKSDSKSYQITCKVRDMQPRRTSHGSCLWPKDPATVDFRALNDNLAHCLNKHGHVCGSKTRLPVQELRVFNCTTRRVEYAPVGAKYVALSYVWGGVAYTAGGTMPKTIEDATTVTQQLGYDYLWVDQLCIDQNGPNKMVQIRQMDRIYRNADVTIVAAAGHNSNYGLPGVGSTPRQRQHCYNIGGSLLVQTKTTQHELLEAAVWSRRGWTYQEDLLSQRSLVFTDQDVWFNCALIDMFMGAESIPTEVRHVEHQRPIKKDLGHPNSGVEHPFNFEYLVMQYSLRALTDPSDILNGFSGFLKVFERAKYPFYHVWGVPIVPPIAKIDDDGLVEVERSTSDGFIRGLWWEIHHEYVEERVVRRSGFPSWSWSGWIGPIIFQRLIPENPSSVKDNTDINISIEVRGGTVLSWAEFEKQSYFKDQPEMISQFIRIDAWTMEVKVKPHLTEPDRRDVSAQMELKDGTHASSPATVFTVMTSPKDHDKFELFQEMTLTGIILPSGLDTEVPSVMLVEEKSGWAERIGSIQLSKMNPRERFGEKRGSWTPDSSLLRLIRREIRLR